MKLLPLLIKQHAVMPTSQGGSPFLLKHVRVTATLFLGLSSYDRCLSARGSLRVSNVCKMSVSLVLRHKTRQLCSHAKMVMLRLRYTSNGWSFEPTDSGGRLVCESCPVGADAVSVAVRRYRLQLA
jgi:hypothetical protein